MSFRNECDEFCNSSHSFSKNFPTPQLKVINDYKKTRETEFTLVDPHPCPRTWTFDRNGTQLFEQTGWGDTMAPQFKEILLEVA